MSDQTNSAELYPYPTLPETNEIIEGRIGKVKNLRSQKVSPYRNGFTPTHLSEEILAKYSEFTKEQLAADPINVSIAGRVMFLRDFGKAGFVRIQDRRGSIQAYVAKDALGPEAYDRFKNFVDLGDIVSCKGFLFRTKTNELSVHATEVVILTKSLRPLPEKFHGLTDIEQRYRHRSLDLITNEKSRQTFLLRSKIIKMIREFFDAHDFLEVETPMMHPIAGGAAARPFKTHHNTLDMELFLRIAPELYLKRLVVGGLDRVYEINRNFRNEGVSIKHNPEFTMLEFYWAYATYDDLMDVTQKLFQSIAQKLFHATKISYQGTEIELGGQWRRLTVEDAVVEYSSFKNRAKTRDREALIDYLKAAHIKFDPKMPTGALLMCVFDEEVEKHLIQPTFITQYPTDVSFLSRRNDDDPEVVDRFELYIYGREMANAFSELNDPLDQRHRLEVQAGAKAAGDEEACDVDEDFLRALEHGLPPTAGEGIGIDRLVMLFTDAASIRDVIFFPQMRHSTDHAAKTS